MKNIKNKVIGFLINLLFSLIWFIVSIYIWGYSWLVAMAYKLCVSEMSHGNTQLSLDIQLIAK